MKNISRREAIGGVLATGVSVLAFGGVADSQTDDLPRAFAGKHQPEDRCPSMPQKLGHFRKADSLYRENDYTGAVKALNLVEQRLAVLAREKETSAVRLR